MPELLTIISTFSIGLFAGALLTEACILVPYWRRMEAAEFFRLHSSLGFNLFRYFAPLTVAAVVLSTITAAASYLSKVPNIWFLASAALCLTALLIFFVYFKKANGKFADHSISETDLPSELKRWASWHWFRTSLVLLAFFSSIVGVST